MRSTDIDVRKHRQPDYDVDDFILKRWSPRAFSDEHPSERDLLSLFDAARWAPSSYNGQPWRFFYARKESKHWRVLHDLMVEFNQRWASRAPVLMIVFSKKTFDHNDKPSRTHAFDTGAAWQTLCLQATARNLIVHGMAGFDYDRAHQFLGLDSDYEVHAMAAIGRAGDPNSLPESMRNKEFPSDRKPLSEVVFTSPPGKD